MAASHSGGGAIFNGGRFNVTPDCTCGRRIRMLLLGMQENPGNDDSPKCPSLACLVGSVHHLMHGSVGPLKSTTQMASLLAKPFFVGMIPILALGPNAPLEIVDLTLCVCFSYHFLLLLVSCVLFLLLMFTSLLSFLLRIASLRFPV